MRLMREAVSPAAASSGGEWVTPSPRICAMSTLLLLLVRHDYAATYRSHSRSVP